MTRGRAGSPAMVARNRRRGHGFLGRVELGLEVVGKLAQLLDQRLLLGALARVPRVVACPAVRDLDLVPGHLGRVAVGVELGDDLIGDDEPVMRRADRLWLRPTAMPV